MQTVAFTLKRLRERSREEGAVVARYRTVCALQHVDKQEATKGMMHSSLDVIGHAMRIYGGMEFGLGEKVMNREMRSERRR